MDAYKLHRYYNEIKPARSMPLAYDTWLSHFDDLYFERLEEQLNVAKELGLEYFTIDAGWFFKPRAWWNSVGDWEEATDCSMCGRMKEFADLVRAKGLKFGLWFEIERAGVESKSLTEHPEHYLMENGYGFVNFGRPETVDYIYKKLEDNIIKYGIEYIKFDYNAELTYDPTNHSFVEFFKGYHEFLHRINREHPEVYLENCASGGLRMSLASLEGFDSFWISDNHSLYTQLEIFKNTLIRMPSRALETWLTIATFKNYTPTYEGEPTEKIIASGNHDWTFAEFINESFLKGVMFGGPIGVSCDLTKLSAKTKELLKEKFEEYKRDRDFWAKSECHILCDTDTMLVLQFNDIDFNEVKIFSFADNPSQNAITVYPVLDANASYTEGDKTSTAAEIEENGVTLAVDWINRRTGNSTVLKKA
jgi:alpha-galactosidase